MPEYHRVLVAHTVHHEISLVYVHLFVRLVFLHDPAEGGMYEKVVASQEVEVSEACSQKRYHRYFKKYDP